MYRVSYVDKETNTIAHKGALQNEEDARAWIKEQGERIKPLKLLVWDNNIDCFSTVEVFNTERGTATATLFLKPVIISC